MKTASFISALFLLSSGLACAAEAAAKYEAVTIAGSPNVNAALFRIEVATGKVVQVWGGAAAYGPTTDSAPLPPGDYHLYVSSNPQPDGTVPWSMSRIESNSGRTWSLTGGGSAPYVWVEVQSGP